MCVCARARVWICVCMHVCVCSLYVHAAGSSGRGGAQIGQVFFCEGGTLENSHTHTHPRQLHVTQWRPADFHRLLFNLLTFFRNSLRFSEIILRVSPSLRISCWICAHFFFFWKLGYLDSFRSASKCALDQVPFNRRMPPSPSDLR